jgi:hypothetical protein
MSFATTCCQGGKQQLDGPEQPAIARSNIWQIGLAALFSSSSFWLSNSDNRFFDRYSTRTRCADRLGKEFGAKLELGDVKGEGHFDSSKESYVAMQYKDLWNHRPIYTFDK